MKVKEIVGSPRTHEDPGRAAFKQLENIMAKKKYHEKLELAEAMANKGFTRDIGRLLTAIRRKGGVAVYTSGGYYTSTPTLQELINDLIKTKNTIIGATLNRMGELRYYHEAITKLRRGGTSEQNEIARNLVDFFEKIGAYGLRMESKCGLRQFRK